ncbi:hypothetical protein UPYG_G00110220 [Umbra pygmaea]|uniref:Bcl-2 Bcl-2 homology region 1-3 domain-containing protein n=1 Tax=Umbra pygmaea TaxID=75934 RepID=A0ABD0X6I5_UMBPY
MACVLTSDDRLGELLLRRVVQEELAEVPSSEGLITETQVDEHEKKILCQLALMIRKIGDTVESNGELNETPSYSNRHLSNSVIDGAVGKMTNKTNYWNVVELVFADGHITWERIAVLFYVAGKVSVKVVLAHIPQLVKDILSWTLEYFRSKLLSWVQEHGGWVNSFSELARVQVEMVTSTSGRNLGFLMVFIGGVLLGSLITWKLQ